MDYRKTLKKTAFMVAGLAAFGLADNPISSYHYLADPGAAADDEYFYVITDSDDPAPADANGYEIKALYGFRTRDMKNWTDFGIIYDARQVEGIGAIWASGIAVNPNDGRLYIVFPDGGGGGIGLIGADSIAGPWTNPLGGEKKLINNWGGGFADCDGIDWCFDPAIFYDSDGQGYFTFGGGSNTSRSANDGNSDVFNIYKLNKDMKGFDVSSKTHLKIGGPAAMEASYIHKYKNNYYLSYSTTGLEIAYGMATNPMGPYTYKGIFMGNPSIGGENINAHNNNHHGIAEFKGHWYVAYHDRRIANGYDGLEKIPAEDGRSNPNAAYHRSVSVDEFTYASDGSMNPLTFTKEGPEQIENFDPYDWYPALTSSKQKGIRSRSNWAPGKVAEHLLLPLSSRAESWIRVSGVDFGTEATGFTVEAASVADGDKVEIHTGSASGTLAGTCTLKNTGSKSTFVENKCEVTGLKGIVDEVFLVFKGSKDSTMAIKAWGFEGSGSTEPTPQTPFGGKAWAIPGKIEAEDFDVPGTGRGGDAKSYSDKDSENHSCTDEGKAAECSDYREGTPVDIYKKADGKIVVGHNQEGEWLEYTVNVAEAGDYTMFASVATDNTTSGFSLSLDGNTLAENVALSGTGFDEFAHVQVNVNFASAGEHVLRMTVTGSWFDLDYLAFAKGKDSSINEVPTVLPKQARLNVVSASNFDVFDLSGKKIASLKARNISEAAQLWRNGLVAGSEKATGIHLIRNRSNGAVAKVRIAR